MSDHFAPSTRYHETALGLRLYADDFTQLPAWWVAGPTLKLAHNMHVNPRQVDSHLREPVTPLMLEACIAGVFGRKIHEQLVAILPQAKPACTERAMNLLEEIAKQVTANTPVEATPEELASMLLTLMCHDYNVYQFITQANKRLAVH